MKEDEVVILEAEIDNLDRQLKVLRNKLDCPPPIEPKKKVRFSMENEGKRFLFLSKARIYTTSFVLIVVIWYLLTR